MIFGFGPYGSGVGLQVIGAGLPRTGTSSLKAALEHLLGGPCYHMFEVQKNPEHAAHWAAALDGDLGALDTALDGYKAAVDWPVALFWPELSAANPDATVVLSHRGDAQTWWESVDKTVWAAMRNPSMTPEFLAFSQQMRAQAGLGDDWDTPEAAMAYYDRISAEVVATVPPDQLVLWQASDGWDPLCDALGVAVPNQDFFHHNTTAEFRERAGFDKG